tara:strand:+ start:238 stop:969 length:732 start_codon:yes stop_codon:yes gene_type:complete
MIVFKDSIYLHSPKTGGTFFRSWMKNNLAHHTKLCQKLIPENIYIQEELDYFKHTLNDEAKSKFDYALENDTLDNILIKIQHTTLEDLNPEFTEGKNVFFFVRNPIEWLYSRVKYGVQIGIFKNIEKSLEWELSNSKIFSSNFSYLDGHNCNIYMMKYEFLYYNIIKMLDLSGIPLRNHHIISLTNKDEANTSKLINGKINQALKIQDFNDAMKKLDTRIQEFYEEALSPYKKLKNFEKPLAK